jgi:hypothetical protein
MVEVSNECGTVSSSDVAVVVSSVEEEALAAGYSMEVRPQPVGEHGVVLVGGPSSAVRVELVDASGRVVKQLWVGELDGQVRRVEFDASAIASGVYRCVLHAGRYRLSTPIVVVR